MIVNISIFIFLVIVTSNVYIGLFWITASLLNGPPCFLHKGHHTIHKYFDIILDESDRGGGELLISKEFLVFINFR